MARPTQPHEKELVEIPEATLRRHLDAQLKDADQRSKEAYRFIEPTGVEICSTPSPYAVEMRQKVSGSGIEVRLFPRYVGGFIHVSQAQGDQPA